MVARWSVNPLGMLWRQMNVALLTSGDIGDPPSAPRRPVVLLLEG
jgi:hypothetical protein